MEAQIGITGENLAEVAHALNTFLADEFHTLRANPQGTLECGEFGFLLSPQIL